MPEERLEKLVKKLKRGKRKYIQDNPGGFVRGVTEFKSGNQIIHKTDDGVIYLKLTNKDGWCNIGKIYGKVLNIEHGRLVSCMNERDFERVPIPYVVIGFLKGLGIKSIRLQTSVVEESPTIGPKEEIFYSMTKADGLRKLYRAGKRKMAKTLLGDCILFRLTDF